MDRARTRIYFCLLFYCIGCNSAYLFAQGKLSQRFDFESIGLPIPATLIQLSRRTGTIIGFSDTLFSEQQGRVEIRAVDEKLSTLLDQILADSEVGWRYSKGQVLLYKLPDVGQVISGYVEDAVSGERLISALIYHPQSGRQTSSNAYGFFSIRIPAKQRPALQVSLLGYQLSAFDNITDSGTTPVFKLAPMLPLKEVVISSDSVADTRDAWRREDNYARLPVLNMPTLGGEADILRIIQSITAGVSSGTDGIGGMSVRGGDPDHNHVLLDDATIFYPTHGVGLFSTINPDIVRSAQFYKGDAPARFGSPIGSVLDIRTREGNMYQASASASVSWIMARLTVEMPIVKEKGAILFSARKSIVRPWIAHFSKHDKEDQGLKGNSVYGFSDFNLKANWILNSRHRLYLSLYRGGDHYTNHDSSTLENVLVVERRTDYRWNNLSVSLRWNQLWSERFFSNTTVTGSRFFLGIGRLYNLVLPELNDSLRSNEYSRSDIVEWSFRTDCDWYVHPSHHLRLGYALNRQSSTPLFGSQFVATAGDDVTVDDEGRIHIHTDLQKQNLFKAALYLEDEWQTLSKSLWIRGGLRLESFGQASKPLKLVLQPRLEADKRLRRNLHLVLSAGRFAQSVRSVSMGDLESVNDLYLLSSGSIPIQFSFQAAGGGYWSAPGWEIRAEYYVKHLQGLEEPLSLNPSVQVINDDTDWNEWLAFGKGHSHGLEWSLKKTQGNTQGWLSYTLSNTKRQYPNLNDNKAYAAHLDRRHNLKISVVQMLPWKIAMGLSWVLASGDALSLNIYEYADPGLTLLDLIGEGAATERTGFGNLRQDWQHRLDFSLSREWQGKKIRQQVILGLYNVYNRQNPYYTLLRPRDVSGETGYVLESVSGLPILPSISYSIGF